MFVNFAESGTGALSETRGIEGYRNAKYEVQVLSESFKDCSPSAGVECKLNNIFHWDSFVSAGLPFLSAAMR